MIVRGSTSAEPITKVDVSVYTIPTDAPEADGTLSWDSTTLVLVELHAGDATGIGFTYADTATARLIHDKLAEIVVSYNAFDIPAAVAAIERAIRNLGRPGIASMAISAVDVALWDLKSRLLDVPLVSLLGAASDSVPIYGSGGFTSYDDRQLQRQLGGWVEQGIPRVKMKIGRDAAADVGRVRSAREAIGADAELFVDANGAYSAKQALRQAERFTDFGVTWFEEPVTSDNLAGLRLIRERAPAGMDIAAGEYGYDPFYFRRMLDAEAVDVLQSDATRCGGISGFMTAAALCAARPLPLSAHTAPSIHAQVCCSAPQMRHLEYFHDHVRIERMLFDGVLEPVGGALVPDRTRPGLGIELKTSDAARWQRHDV